jgi:hypothetical protein
MPMPPVLGSQLDISSLEGHLGPKARALLVTPDDVARQDCWGLCCAKVDCKLLCQKLSCLSPKPPHPSTSSSSEGLAGGRNYSSHTVPTSDQPTGLSPGSSPCFSPCLLLTCTLPCQPSPSVLCSLSHLPLTFTLLLPAPSCYISSLSITCLYL